MAFCVQDGELDDCLAWLLLDKIHSTKSAPSLLLEALGFTDQFHVLFQLPVDSRMDRWGHTHAYPQPGGPTRMHILSRV